MILLPALLGLILCLLNASGAKIFCLTTGCEIYAGYSFFGLSFYTIGSAAFALILLLTLLARQHPRALTLLYGTILGGITLDLLFLIWQILYWPCSSCLLVALLLGWLAGALLWRHPRLQCALSKGLLAVWLVLLITVSIAIAKETLLAPWALYGPPDAEIRVFFSPSCPACATEVSKLLHSPEIGRTAFYPIAKNEGDRRRIAALLKQGITSARDLEELFASGRDAAGEPSATLRWRLARNKMTLARYGVTTIPLILSKSLVAVAKPSIADLLSSPPPPTTTAPVGTTGCGVTDHQETPCQ